MKGKKKIICLAYFHSFSEDFMILDSFFFFLQSSRSQDHSLIRVPLLSKGESMHVCVCAHRYLCLWSNHSK